MLSERIAPTMWRFTLPKHANDPTVDYATAKRMAADTRSMFALIKSEEDESLKEGWHHVWNSIKLAEVNAKLEAIVQDYERSGTEAILFQI